MVSLIEDAEWNQKVKIIEHLVDEIASRMLHAAALIEISTEYRQRVVDDARTHLISACIEHETASLYLLGLFRRHKQILSKAVP